MRRVFVRKTTNYKVIKAKTEKRRFSPFLDYCSAIGFEFPRVTERWTRDARRIRSRGREWDLKLL